MAGVGIDGKQLKLASVADNKLGTPYIKADGTRAFTGNQAMGSNKITGLANGTGADEAVNRGQLDAAVLGLNWQAAAAVMYYVGTRDIADIDLLTPAAGWSVVAGDAGTPAAGTSDALVAGDIAEFDGTSWIKIVDQVGGFPPNGTRAVIAWPAAAVLFAPLTNGTDEGKIAQWDGTSLTPASKSTPVDGYAVLCKGSATDPSTGYNEGKAFSFTGVVPNGSWNQVGAAVPFGTPVSVGTANAAGSSPNAARADHEHDSPVRTQADKAKAPLVTTGNYSDTGITITETPALGCDVEADIDGVMCNVGDGDRDDLGDFTNNVLFYFAAPGTAGAAARAKSAIVAGDELWFNGGHAGYELAITDSLNLRYSTFA